MTKAEQLKNWMKKKKIFSTSDVIKKGLEIYSVRADRTKRDFMELGLIRALTPKELKRRKLEGKREKYYKWEGGKSCLKSFHIRLVSHF